MKFDTSGMNHYGQCYETGPPFDKANLFAQDCAYMTVRGTHGLKSDRAKPAILAN